MRKQCVIWTRFSSDMQRAESCTDQERKVRVGLDAKGVDHSNARVFRVEAESGTKLDGAQFAELTRMIRDGEVGELAVDDQSRFSRSDQAFALIQDLVFYGGRFISVGEGIDTNEPGWELRVRVLELHHSTSSRELANRVRRGQEGRILDGNGSAGDYCFGYRSDFGDPNQATWAGRGPKPKKVVVIYKPEAKVVRMIFAWFVGGMSISEIVRKLNSLNVDKGHRSSRMAWYHQIVRRILANTKYIGSWAWGKTQTRKNSRGRKKQVPVDASAVVTSARPDLRIIDDVTWKKAQALLQRLQGIYGQRAHQKRRGKPIHYTELYPQSLLGGMIFCSSCSARMIAQKGGGGYRYLACPNHRNGTCGMVCRVAVARAEKAIIDFIGEALSRQAAWIDTAVATMRKAIEDVATAVPDALAADEQSLQKTEKGIARLTNALVEGAEEWSPALRAELMTLEAKAADLRERIDQQRRLLDQPLALPDDGWIRDQLAQLPSVLKEDERGAALLLRKLIGKATAHEIRARGKKRGFAQLRFRIDAFQTLGAVLEGCIDVGVVMMASAGKSPVHSPEFTIDLGSLTRMDTWGPRIAELRQKGVPWNAIGRISGLGSGNAWTAFKRWTAGSDGETAVA